MALHCPLIHHCPQTPSSSDVPSHRLNWYCQYPPHQDHPPCTYANPSCQHRPHFKTKTFNIHINSIPYPIWLAPQVSQQFRKPQVLSPPEYSILSRRWVDLRKYYFRTYYETSPRTSYYPSHLTSHKSTPSSNVSNYLPWPPPPTHLSWILLPSPPRYCSPRPSIFAVWEGKIENKQ